MSTPACLLAACTLALGLSASSALARETEHEHAHEHDHGEHPEVERILITATPLEHTRDELATPVDRLDRDEILERASSSLGETLAGMPGVATSGFAAGANRPVIRGQDAFRTEVLEDGLATHDVSRLSPDHGVPIHPLSAKSIEVVRGPATLRYGGGAVAGVVNVITGRVPQRRPNAPLTADFFGSYGSNGDEGVVALLAEGAVGRVAWHADGAYQRADDYETGAGNVQTGTRRKGGTASAGGAYLGDGVRIGGAYSHFTSDYGIPELGQSVTIEMDTHRYRFEADADVPLEGLRELRIVGVYSDYEHVEIAGGQVGQEFGNDEFEGRGELLHEPVAGFTGALGITGRRRDFSARGEAAEFLSPTHTRTLAGYLYEEANLADLVEIQLGLRVESSEVRGIPLGATKRTLEFVPLSGSVGLVTHPIEGWTLGLTGAASQRAPADVELFARGPHEATGTFELGSQRLDEETAYGGEIRLSGELGRIRIEVASFLTSYDGYIFGGLTGASVDAGGNPVASTDPAALDELRYRARDARFYGGEVGLEADLLELSRGTLELDAQFDWVRARFTNLPAGVDRDVPRITPLRWGGGLGYRGDRLRGRIGFLRSERQRHPGDNETATGAYTLVDLSLAVSLGTPGDLAGVDLTIDARNLADEAARNPIAFNKNEVRLRGRTIRFGLRGRL